MLYHFSSEENIERIKKEGIKTEMSSINGRRETEFRLEESRPSEFPTRLNSVYLSTTKNNIHISANQDYVCVDPSKIPANTKFFLGDYQIITDLNSYTFMANPNDLNSLTDEYWRTARIISHKNLCSGIDYNKNYIQIPEIVVNSTIPPEAII